MIRPMNMKLITLTLLTIAATGGFVVLSNGFDLVPDETAQEEPQALKLTHEDESGDIHANQWFNLEASKVQQQAAEEEGTAQNLDKPRPAYWPEELKQRQETKKSKEGPTTDCVVRNYKVDVNQPVMDNLGNIKDAEVNCKVKVIKNLP